MPWLGGRIHMAGKIGSTRRELDGWIRTLPQPWMIMMEATIFSGWIYDHLLPHTVASGFLWDNSSSCTQVDSSGSPAPVAPGESCNAVIDFQPTAVGTNSGSVVLTDNNLKAAYAMQSVALSGTGLMVTPTVTWPAANAIFTVSR